MGLYSKSFDDQAVENKAIALCVAEGHDPHQMTYENDGGIPYPYGDLWTRYIDEAIDALAMDIADKPSAISKSIQS